MNTGALIFIISMHPNREKQEPQCSLHLRTQRPELQAIFLEAACPPAVGMIQGHSSPNVKVTRMMYNIQLVDFLRDGMYEEQIQSYVNGSALVVNQICI